MCTIGGILTGTVGKLTHDFTMMTMEIYLHTCHNIVTNVYYSPRNVLGIRVGMGLKIFRLITPKSTSIDLRLPS